MAAVLIAEDEPNIAEVLQFLLEQDGFESCIAYDGQAALDSVRRQLPDVMVLDAMLPKLDGFEVLKAVRADPSLAALPILMLTAKGQSRDRELAAQLGVSAFITKPFANAEVVACVARLAGNTRR